MNSRLPQLRPQALFLFKCPGLLFNEKKVLGARFRTSSLTESTVFVSVDITSMKSLEASIKYVTRVGEVGGRPVTYRTSIASMTSFICVKAYFLVKWSKNHQNRALVLYGWSRGSGKIIRLEEVMIERTSEISQ